MATIDDHPLVLEGIRQILRQAGHEVIEPAPGKEQLAEWLQDHQVDAVTLDIGMPGQNGIELARQLRAALPHLAIVIVTQQTDKAYLRAAFQAGAHGFVSKQAASADLIVALAAASKRRIYISPQVLGSAPGTRAALKKWLYAEGEILTTRQQSVLQHIADGMTMKEIALAMRISVKTVEFHKKALVDVLGISSTAELTKYAIAHGHAFLPT